MIQVNRIYLIFNRLVTKKFLVDTSEPKDKKADFLLAYRYDLDPKYEINPQDNEDEDMD